MRKLIPTALALIFSANASAEEPEIGDYFNTSDSEMFRSWKSAGGGLWGTEMQPYDIFYKGDDFLVLLTEAVTRNRSGGLLVKKITAKTKTSKRPSEEWTHCSFAGQETALAFYDPKAKVARAFFVVGDTIEERSWNALDGDCYMGD